MENWGFSIIRKMTDNRVGVQHRVSKIYEQPNIYFLVKYRHLKGRASKVIGFPTLSSSKVDVAISRVELHQRAYNVSPSDSDEGSGQYP
jgi:hypothetical protein